MTDRMLSRCQICGGDDWVNTYTGPIRDGTPGKIQENSTVESCLHCGIQRLSEHDCIPENHYTSGEYRLQLGQSLSRENAIIDEDNMQEITFEALGSIERLRNCRFADVGCGTGTLLAATQHRVDFQIGIEPCQSYIDSLERNGYTVFPSLTASLNVFPDSFDWVLSIQVIEHVPDPLLFLQQIYSLLKPGGRALISMPNRKDILMSLLPSFHKHFYHTAHRWYFDQHSLEACATRADFEIVATRFVYRYGLTNTLLWLKDRRPRGKTRIKAIDETADCFWKSYLEETGQSGTIYTELTKSN